MPSTKELNDLGGKKRWRIRNWEVVGSTLKDALFAEVRQHECLAWVLVEPDSDEEFEYRRQESLDCDEELDETEIWTRVWEGEELMWMDLLSDINNADGDDDKLLEAVFLTWDDVEILATECDQSWCTEMVEADDSHRCPKCHEGYCSHCRDDEFECRGCGHEWTGVDFMRMAVNN